MPQTYLSRRRMQDAPAARKFDTSVPGPSIQELAAGAMPSTEQIGRRVDLPDAIREKMEASFGADFSGVKVYESQTVADAGAEAMTMGSNVAFAPGQLDLTSTSGQALLGHELSHVVSQARGESAGRGFLADSGLEAQADRQGMLAAQGESAYSGPVAPLSSSAVPASAGGVAQAKKKEDIANDALIQEAERSSREGGLNRALTAYRDNAGQARSVEEMTGALQRGGHYGYVSNNLDRMDDPDEQQRFLSIFLGGDQNAINDYMRNDALTLTQSMAAASPNLISESFRTRADAYTGSRTYDERLDAFRGENLSRLLNREEQASFQSASDNFQRDRQMAQESMQAHATDQRFFTGDAYTTEQERAKRKAYRKHRRNGKAARGF